jgi:hypothetical protein
VTGGLRDAVAAAVLAAVLSAAVPARGADDARIGWTHAL